MDQNNRSNIILIGFMASGKSRIGEMLAKRLGYELIDTDAIIEGEQNQSIKEIFAKRGEWYFRGLETEAIKKLRHKENTVIVAGGGAPVFFDNAQIFKTIGHVFYLDASLALILKRLQKNDSRPLGALATLQDIEKIKALYIYRRPIYLGLGILVDVNHENKAKTCDEIIERYKSAHRLNRIAHSTVFDVEQHYPIIHQKNSLDILGDLRTYLGLKDHRPVIVTTTHLKHVLEKPIAHIRQKFGADGALICFGDGEQYKNFESIHHIHAQMFAHGLMRNTVVIALGGGNVGDVAGFAASTFLRGVPFLQIPTTLLAMVDASIGGKTGIDLALGKNLVGAFYNPKAVVIDPELLATLPKDDFACGMAEVIKAAIIADRALFYAIKNDELDLSAIIERTIKVKAFIVLADPREKNIRAHLNLGHTFAHAIEKVSNYTIKHGAAVAIGLMEATKLSRKLGILEEDFQNDLEAVLKKFELPTTLPSHLKKSDLLDAMKLDKKRDDAGLRFILPKRLGEVITSHVDESDVWGPAECVKMNS